MMVLNNAQISNFIIMEIEATPKRLTDYLDELQSRGKLTFVSTELPEKLNVNVETVKKYLQRLKAKKKVFQIRREFWAIVPPEYYARGVIPMTLFVDDLMKFLKKDYYIALHSAAQMFGAAHQQPMEFCLMIKRTPMRNIRNKRLALKFIVKESWFDQDIIQKQTDTGFINISSPELTALDLMYFSYAVGGKSMILTIISELIESIKPSKLYQTAKRYNHTPTVQRLGYIIDHYLENDKISNVLKKIIDEKKPRIIPFSVKHQTEGFEINRKWSIIPNLTKCIYHRME
jgi:predicted transcriptional regulator of viral defense system